MTQELIERLITQLPNFVGLVVLSYVLWLINEQTNARLDLQFDYLLTCLTQQGIQIGPH